MLLEEALVSHIEVLKIRNAEIEESRERIRQSEAKYKNLALYDSITGLPSRILFQERLARALLHAKKTEASVALLFIDIDHFKAVNDRGGHESGDAVLRETGKRIVACLREEDTAARFGGDEFVVLLEDLHDRQSAMKTGERVMAAMAVPFEVNGEAFAVSISIGISLYPCDGEDIDSLLKSADAAMYGVKRKGRNGLQFYQGG
ncbi:diguanylate cyclase domain-containing protein [Anaeroselena agilis]|uniref:GGDEF domain-containing protein n=1 Tax=Anaeroselena agilis TaxID=3063788 RepID=A0ABU3NZ25_9FIRM|nr:GGDEF domain-containing protein [Selenomonadales bacterium 4137-cl]